MDQAKRGAGRRAAEFIEHGMTLGLGTGSTVFFTLERLAERIAEEHLEVRCVPTSLDTESKARAMGIPLVPLAEVEQVDLTIDGADEIDADFNMIKGGGGALLREKVVASISEREVIVIHRSKFVERLGTTFLLPIEVVPFARPTVGRRLEALGAVPSLRMASSDEAYRTDNGGAILDCRFEHGIEDAPALEGTLQGIPGIVENGLFVGLAHVLVIGDSDGSSEVREA